MNRSAIMALFAGAFAVSCTEFIPVGLLPQIAEETGVSESVAGQLVTANALAFAVGAPLLAALFTRVDRRKLLLGTLAAFVGGHLLAGAAPNFAVLLVSRLVTGAMMGLYLATAIATAAKLAGPERRARAMATIVAGVSTATALGVPVSTLLGQRTGWRVPMLGIAALAGVAIAIIALRVPRSGADDGPPLRTRLGALGNRPVIVGLAAITVFWGASFTVYTYLVPLLEQRSGLHGAPVTAVLFLAGLGAVLGNIIGGRGADARLPLTLLLTSAITAAALVAALPLVNSPGGAIALVAVWQLAAWSFVPAVQAALYQAAGPGGDLAVSFAVSGFNVGIVGGAGLGGVALDLGGLTSVVLLGAGLSLVAVGLVVLLISYLRKRATEAEGEPVDDLFDGRRFDAVLFDMDGTLIDSKPAVARAWRTWAERHGVDPELVARSTGRPAKEIVADLLPADRVADAVADYDRIASETVQGVVVLPGAPEALADTGDLKAIVTSCTRSVTRARMDAAGLGLPGAVVTADDVDSGKPAPEPYLRGARALSLDPARCLVVEDSAAGVESGRAAGCATLAIGSAAEDGSGADVRLTDLSRVRFTVEDGRVAVRTRTEKEVPS
ncbi:MFS transporter [Actinomadura flavalba]|uniref:MFS transporter n=1 Tax=Actinomadura flavalba TaxID=1120938 RepID=UPI0006855F59|nr:MFS transporter [Actinomadura flavalba]